MQRKNNFLMRRSHRNGMAMIMAISVIVVVATIMALSLALTSQTSKKTTDIYLYEQSMLLAKSATEYQLLRITQNPPCSNLDDNFRQDTIYDVNITTRYIYNNNNPCTANANPGTIYVNVDTPEQNGSVLIDVAVSINDATIATEPIRYFKRTIQKL